jgi:hypothetical protein
VKPHGAGWRTGGRLECLLGDCLVVLCLIEEGAEGHNRCSCLAPELASRSARRWVVEVFCSRWRHWSLKRSGTASLEVGLCPLEIAHTSHTSRPVPDPDHHREKMLDCLVVDDQGRDWDNRVPARDHNGHFLTVKREAEKECFDRQGTMCRQEVEVLSVAQESLGHMTLQNMTGWGSSALLGVQKVHVTHRNNHCDLETAWVVREKTCPSPRPVPKDQHRKRMWPGSQIETASGVRLVTGEPVASFHQSSWSWLCSSYCSSSSRSLNRVEALLWCSRNRAWLYHRRLPTSVRSARGMWIPQHHRSSMPSPPPSYVLSLASQLLS